jgi:hypothetical protein
MSIFVGFSIVVVLGLTLGLVVSRVICAGFVLGFIVGVPTGAVVLAVAERRTRSKPGEGTGINTAIDRIGGGL